MTQLLDGAFYQLFPEQCQFPIWLPYFLVFFTSNNLLDLSYYPYEDLESPLGGNFSYPEKGFLCFTVKMNDMGDCIELHNNSYGRMDLAGWDKKNMVPLPTSGGVNLTLVYKVTYMQRLFIEGVKTNGTYRQPKVLPYSNRPDNRAFPPWTDCQSRLSIQADKAGKFTISPNIR